MVLIIANKYLTVTVALGDARVKRNDAFESFVPLLTSQAGSPRIRFRSAAEIQYKQINAFDIE